MKREGPIFDSAGRLSDPYPSIVHSFLFPLSLFRSKQGRSSCMKFYPRFGFLFFLFSSLPFSCLLFFPQVFHGLRGLVTIVQRVQEMMLTETALATADMEHMIECCGGTD